MGDLTGKTIPPDPAEKCFLEHPPKGKGIEIFPGRFQPETGKRLRVTHQEKFPFPEHLVTQRDRGAIEQHDIHVVGPEGIARRLNVLHEGAGMAVGSLPCPGQDRDVHIAAVSPVPRAADPKRYTATTSGNVEKRATNSEHRASGIAPLLPRDGIFRALSITTSSYRNP